MSLARQVHLHHSSRISATLHYGSYVSTSVANIADFYVPTLNSVLEHIKAHSDNLKMDITESTAGELGPGGAIMKEN